MRESVWKYLSLILAILLALSSVSIVLLSKSSGTIVVVSKGNTSLVLPNFTVNWSPTVSELQDRLAFLKELVRSTNKTNVTIAVVPVFGVIDDSSALQLVPLLRRIARNSSIGGVLLWIESPGGDVGAVMNIYSVVRDVALVKPVVAYTGGLAASGGYYIACGADKIVANSLAQVGSIGVIYVHYDLHQNYAKNGIIVDVFKTGPYKDMGAEWRALTPQEKKMIWNEVYTYFSVFLEAVSRGRHMPIKEIREKYASGRVWFAKDVNGSLVDRTGGMDVALSILESLMNVTSARIVTYSITPTYTLQFTDLYLYLDPRYLPRG